MKSEPKLVLFDVDGTLVYGNTFLDNYRVFLSEQLSQFFKVPFSVDLLGLHGGTEKENLRILLGRQGISPSEEEFGKLFNVMGRNYAASSLDVELLPHVRETIEELSEMNFMLGLTTGNPEVIARKKLQVLGLNDYFKIGCFGNEKEHRGELVKTAFDRAVEYGWKNHSNGAYVIGDTSRDVESGKFAGLKTVAVLTGYGTREQLENAKPDHIIENLSGLRKILIS